MNKNSPGSVFIEDRCQKMQNCVAGLRVFWTFDWQFPLFMASRIHQIYTISHHCFGWVVSILNLVRISLVLFLSSIWPACQMRCFTVLRAFLVKPLTLLALKLNQVLLYLWNNYTSVQPNLQPLPGLLHRKTFP